MATKSNKLPANLLTPYEWAQKAGLPLRTVERRINAGELPVHTRQPRANGQPDACFISARDYPPRA